MIRFDIGPTLSLLDGLSRKDSRGPAPELSLDPTLLPMYRRFGVGRGRASLCLRSVGDRRLRARLAPSEAALSAHLGRILEREREVREMLHEIRLQGPSLARRAMTRAMRFLPPFATVRTATVVFLPQGYDCRVDSTSVYFDPLLALLAGIEGVADLLSHELHHVGRFLLTNENISGLGARLKDRVSDLRSAVRIWITLLEMEGIADCVFDMSDLDLPVHRRMIATRRRVFASYSMYLKKIETDLLNASLGPGTDSSRFRRTLPMIVSRVHPVGHRLAREILGTLGEGGLTECVGKPGLFLESYQRVAEESNLFAFHPSILAAIRDR